MARINHHSGGVQGGLAANGKWNLISTLLLSQLATVNQALCPITRPGNKVTLKAGQGNDPLRSSPGQWPNSLQANGRFVIGRL